MNAIHYQVFGVSFVAFDKSNESSTRMIDSVFHHLLKDCHETPLVKRVSIKTVNVY